MADIGPINVDYRSPKITDDLIQIGAGVQSAQRENLLSQIESRTLTTQMGAANTASQIGARTAATEVAQAKASNLINMNRAANRREDAKLPYVLEGLEAKNWISQTVARNNELKNELADLTMMDQVEQEAIQTSTQYENLQSNRMKNEVARKEQESYSLNLPAYENFWSGVESGAIDPDTAPRPPYGGNGRLNDLHQQRINGWRASSTGKAAETKAVETARDEAEARAEMSAPQIAAIDNAPNPQQAAVLRQQAREANQQKARLREVNPGEADSVIENIKNNIDPVTKAHSGTLTTGGVMQPPLTDPNGNPTTHGKQAMAEAMKRLAASAANAGLAATTVRATGATRLAFQKEALEAGVGVEVVQTDTTGDGRIDEYRFTNVEQIRAAVTAIAAKRAKATTPTAANKASYVSQLARELMSLPNPNQPAVHGLAPNYTPTEAAQAAEGMWNLHFPSRGPSSAGATIPPPTAAPVGTPAQQSLHARVRASGGRDTARSLLVKDSATPGPNQEASQEALDDLDKATGKMYALDRLMRGKQPKEGPGNYGGKWAETAWKARGQTEGYSHATGKSTVPINEQDIDWEKFSNREAGKFVGHAEFSTWYSPDDEDTFDEAITKEMTKIVKQMGGKKQVWNVFKPHPYAIRQFGLEVPDLQSFDSSGHPPRQMPVRVYINDTNRPVGARWVTAPSRDHSRAPYTVKEMKDKLKQQLGVSYGSILMEGVDFQKGTGAPLVQNNAKLSMTWDRYRKEAGLKP